MLGGRCADLVMGVLNQFAGADLTAPAPRMPDYAVEFLRIADLYSWMREYQL